MKFKFILTLLVCNSILGCGSAKLRSLQAIPKEFYLNEEKKINEYTNKSVIESGKIQATNIALATVYLKVIFQKDSTFDPKDPNYIEYQPWWNTQEGMWGFTGVAQSAYERISNEIENRFGRVMGINESAYRVANKKRLAVSYPVKVPTGGIESKKDFGKYLGLGVATSYNYAAFSANQGRSVAQVTVKDGGAVFFPYFNIYLNKDLAKVAKMDGELIINYKAFVNGYFMLCNESKCEQATLPKGHHLTISVPLPPKEALVNKKKQEQINLFAQKHLGLIMSNLAMSALDVLKSDKK